jgi:para-nitrobenzyl esterase
MIANRLGREPEPSAAADLVAAYERAGLAGGALWSALQTDGLMRLPAERLAELQHGAGGRAFRYQLAWHPTQGDAAQAGAFHAMDLPFVFDAFDTTEWGAYLGIDEAGRAVARAMRTAFATFARTGTPGSPPQLDPWPPYDTDRRATTVLADDARPVDDFLATERRAWAGLWSEACRPCPVPI